MRLDADLESIQEVRDLLDKAEQAQEAIVEMSKEQADETVHQRAQGANQNAGKLAGLAVDEKGYGKEGGKHTKNLFAAQDVYQSLRHEKTEGVIDKNEP